MEQAQIKFPWKQILVICSFLLILFLLPPFLENGLILGHDTFLHTAYIHAFDHAFFQGQLPVRVIDWFFPGANVPLFNFYQPGFYYFMVFLKLFGFSYSSTLNFGLFLLWILSGIFMYLFVRERFGFLAGLTSAFLFVFAPYHIVDIYVRTAFPEFAALACFPAIFWLVTRFAKTRNKKLLLFTSLTIGLAALTHPPTFVMFAPIIIGYSAFLAWENASWELLQQYLVSFFLGLLVISFFILPVIFEQQYVHMELTRADKLFDFHNHFLCVSQLFKPTWGYGLSVKGCNDQLSFQLGIVHWAVVFAAVCFLSIGLFSKDKRIKRHAVLAGLFGIALVCSFYMTNAASTFLWEHIPYLPYIEFPWRFLAVSIFVASFLGGYVMSFSHKNAAYIVYALLLYGIFYWYIPYLHAHVTDATDFNSQQYLLNDPAFQSAYYSPQQTFFPIFMKKLPDQKIVPDSEIQILTGKGTVENTDSTATQKIYALSLQTQSTVRLYIHYFPGWEVRENGKVIPISYSNTYGYIDTLIPPGTHTLTAQFTDTPIRTVGNLLSLLTLIALPVFYIKRIQNAIKDCYFSIILAKKN